MQTIIFLSGWRLPEFVSKSSLFFNDSFWKGYNRVYYKSKSPISDQMVNQELSNLVELINNYKDTVVIGHSLGAWWAANLACHPQTKINKLALWTPLGNTKDFPIFNLTTIQEPINKITNIHNIGINKTFITYAKYDLIVPYKNHAIPLINKFNATSLSLNGGHTWQKDHNKGLLQLKQWIEL